MTEGKQYIVFFDGVCNLCTSSIQFIIRRDKKKVITFSSLQSNFAEELLPSTYTEQLSSIIVFDNGNLLNESDAILSIAGKLGPMYSWMRIFRIVPRFIRDNIYRWIASNRYRWFGKKDSCMVPTPELLSRFKN